MSTPLYNLDALAGWAQSYGLGEVSTDIGGAVAAVVRAVKAAQELDEIVDDCFADWLGDEDWPQFRRVRETLAPFRSVA